MKKSELQNQKRVFKFRFWDKEKKKMLTPPFKGLKGICLIPTSPSWSATDYWDAEKKIGFDCSAFDWADAGILTGRMVIMQSIGLRDKNGIEIYEGDIFSNHKSFSKFKKGEARLMVVEYCNEYSKFGLACYSIKGREYGVNEIFSSSVGIYVNAGAHVIGHRFQEKFSQWIKNENV
jgi:uncharacterized phage protein (TIGR01671 family)